MSDGTLERLRDRELQPFVVAHDEPALSSAEASAAWALLVDAAGGVVGAWAPGARDRCPAVVVADADMTVDGALRSEAFGLLEPGSAVVLRDEQGAFLGVWADADLEDALAAGPTRFAPLPGEIAISEVVLHCRFEQDGTTCGSSLSFLEKPAVWPACPNLSNLPPHTFTR
jgi:hypothetical protein